MARIPCRKFGIGDGMIFVAASAAGFGLVRVMSEASFASYPWWFMYGAIYANPMVVSLTLALVAIRFRKPRPARARLFRQPGIAASVSATVMIVIWGGVIGFVPVITQRGWENSFIIFSFSPIGIGPGVFGAWLVMSLSRARRPEPGWIDRAGIALGLAWIGLMLMDLTQIVK